MKILALSGSLRAASINSAVLRTVKYLAPASIEVRLFSGLGDLPLYNPDLESALPGVAQHLRNEVAAADALLIASPEYAHGVTGTVKNALDWLVAFEGFADKPVAVLNAAPRAHHADAALRETLVTMSATLIEAASITLALPSTNISEAELLAAPEIVSLLTGVITKIQRAVKRLPDMKPYLSSSLYIDSQHPAIVAQAAKLADGCADEVAITKRCFEFVRDQIKHSWDYRLNPVTCKASEVLIHGTGYCYAKSHLLAALLRANAIPAGLCYQRLTLDGDQPPFCLHGLNAVYLPQHGWYRVDARGNKPGVEADFCPPLEKLAFPIMNPLEQDLPGILAEPLPAVVKALTENQTIELVYQNLPDIAATEP
ncbi:NAD(P)H-dependent oxidoreductase [Methylomonas sp. MO1]|uniref:NAD(P)H-dependent oxidoreductase n=1 Tax=Methylomonas sp. MO1 TaxID=3073619 RepID=UPI0028A3D848|nr:NAD(P)H-dependent oxidoreductase [Methylomonas sp. MO1]MDT4292084.1 NAD(P)H-dependent oxidoreductase [Methylomonas sp. MO1]